MSFCIILIIIFHLYLANTNLRPNFNFFTTSNINENENIFDQNPEFTKFIKEIEEKQKNKKEINELTQTPQIEGKNTTRKLAKYQTFDEIVLSKG